MDTVLDFLSLVWGDRQGWVDIPSKAGGHWITFSALWPEDKDLIRRRIDGCLEDQEDVYFSVSQFGEEGRRIKDTMSSAWLWADLDRVGPDDCAALDLVPTVCWESSPWRYQALWHLDRRIKPEDLARVNKALSYAIGADKGGWDLTQVLRPVGTRNFKYPGGPEVMEVYTDGPEYRVKDLWARLKDHIEPARPARKSLRRERGVSHTDIPARARALLAVPSERVVIGERSNKLWELNCLLAEAGMEEDEILELVAPSAWNKWPRSETRLRADIAKAIDHVERKALGEAAPHERNGGKSKRDAATTVVERVIRADDEDLDEIDLSQPSAELAAEEAEKRVDLPFVRYSGFMAQNLEAPRWLIQDLWMTQSHGIIGGEAKSSKSLLALAMGLSIASGKPFLGFDRFGVSSPGPVLMIQEENSPWDIQDRMRKLARLYKLISGEDIERTPAEEGMVARQTIRLSFPTDAPLLLLNNFGYDMSTEENRDAIEESIQREGAAMVILDPLYLMLGSADADRAHEVRPFQKWLLELKYTYGVAVVLVHHFGKPRVDDRRRAGHKLLGSGTWYNWVDSALYAEPKETEVGWFGNRDHRGSKVNRRLMVEREWRSAAPQGPLDVRMHFGAPGSLKLIVEVDEVDTRDIRTGIKAVVENAGPDGILLTEIAKTLSVDRRTIRKYVVGSGSYEVKGTKRGRGQSFRVFPIGAGSE